MMAREERPVKVSRRVTKNLGRSVAPPPPPPPPKRASSIPPPPPPAAFVQDYGRIQWPSEQEPSTNWSIGIHTSHPKQYTVKDILDEQTEGAEFLTANYAFDDEVLNEQLGDIELLTARYSYDD